MPNGTIGGIADDGPAPTGGATPVAGNAVAAGPAATPIPVHAGGTDNAPIEAARPTPAVAADPVVKPVSVTEPAVPAAAAGAAARPAVAPLAPLAPVINMRMSMLIGIIAIRNGIINEERPASDDVEAPDGVSVAGAARLCNAAGVVEISCGPWDINVSVSVPVVAAADCASEKAWVACPDGSVVCGGEVNGLTWVATADAPA